ncbi:MAG: site-2 protease family protein [Nitrospinota bacterium]|nr:site-2 protease family protein [Nitrospinota bacterium]
MSIIGAALIVGSAIIIHELGHLIAARMAGIPIAVFSLGFGPRVAGFMWGETEVIISLFPVGGYVEPDGAYLWNYDDWRPRDHIIFALGGPLANFTGALLIIGLVNYLSGQTSAYGLLVAPVIIAMNISGGLLASISHLIAQPQEVSSVVGLTSIGAEFLESGFIMG